MTEGSVAERKEGLLSRAGKGISERKSGKAKDPCVNVLEGEPGTSSFAKDGALLTPRVVHTISTGDPGSASLVDIALVLAKLPFPLPFPFPLALGFHVFFSVSWLQGLRFSSLAERVRPTMGICSARSLQRAPARSARKASRQAPLRQTCWPTRRMGEGRR